MSVISSSFVDLSSNSSNSSFNPFVECFITQTNIYIFTAFSITNLLLLPVFIFVLYLGFQRWRKQRSTSTASTSHSDIFTYHCVTMQLNELLGFILYFCGSYMDLRHIAFAGFCVCSLANLGQTLFHILTCVERYLAIVHPITYLGLKQAGGVKSRNYSIGCVWLITFGWLPAIFSGSSELNSIVHLCVTGFSLIVISFCSISVLRTLKRPGPGHEGGNRERVDQSKQRAFYTIVTIMGALLLSLTGNLFANVMSSSDIVKRNYLCVLMMSIFFFDVPSSLVLPLLFLYRAGKLRCCKQNTESG